MDRLAKALEDNAISGRVLLHCDLMELKSVIQFWAISLIFIRTEYISFSSFCTQVLGLNFGHWEIFRLLVNCLRDIEKMQPSIKPSEDIPVMPGRRKTVIEKQVGFGQ